MKAAALDNTSKSAKANKITQSTKYQTAQLRISIGINFVTIIN